MTTDGGPDLLRSFGKMDKKQIQIQSNIAKTLQEASPEDAEILVEIIG